MASSLPVLLLVLCSLGVAQALLRVYSLRARGLNGDSNSETDGYVKLFYNSTSMGMTSSKVNTNNPYWNEEFTYPDAEQGSTLKVEAYDEDIFFPDNLGSCQYLLKQGTWKQICYLEDGGVLYFTYTLT